MIASSIKFMNFNFAVAAVVQQRYLESVVRTAGFEPAIPVKARSQIVCGCQFRHARLTEPGSMKMPPALLFVNAAWWPSNCVHICVLHVLMMPLSPLGRYTWKQVVCGNFACDSASNR